MSFPAAHRAKLPCTNPIERPNGEIKRRTDVVGIFPNEDTIVRLVGAILLERNDEWAVQRSRHMSLETIAPWQQRAGLGNSPRAVLEQIRRIQSHDVILPTTTHGELRLRCVTQPYPAQAALVERLGIVLTKRMRLAELDHAEFALSA